MAIKSKDTKPIKFYILSFFIPLFFAVIALAFAGIYPFGTKSIAGSDLGSQFLPVTVLKADMLKNGIKSFFTYKCGFGANAVSLFFGNTSILDSLFLFFDKLYYQDVFFAVYIIKIGLGGLCAYIYFDRSRIICCDALTALALSVLYAV